MNNLNELNKIIKSSKNELNSLYENLDNNIIKSALKICELDDTKSQRLAILRRIIDLKNDPLENELKKLNIKSRQQIQVKERMYEFVRNFYEKRFDEIINKIKEKNILDEFYLELLELINQSGKQINIWQKAWQKKIIDETNAKFKEKFSTLKEANEFINKNNLYQKENGKKADRSYGAVILNDNKYKFVPYAIAFKDEVENLTKVIKKYLDNLKKLSKNEEHEAFINYFSLLKDAFLQTDNDKVISSWQDAERAWMKIHSFIQPGHPLEYYEDAYTHAVALEWDIRLVDDEAINDEKFKKNMKDSFLQIYEKLKANDKTLKDQVISNIDKTQLYISNPMFYYGAELDGLFSAQVVPNDETVSLECGKKIFAFVNHVYESSKAKPFMKLSSEIFDNDFLDFGREILFTKPELWKKIYEISTIGHEFGHLLFISHDTETKMNKNGTFKFIEEYKATTGGLINFFLHEEDEFIMPVFHDLISRTIGLIAWMEADEVRAYYTEGLIHLSLLFETKVLEFTNKKLKINFTTEEYKVFKKRCLEVYENLAKIYLEKSDANKFLDIFCEKYNQTYLPINNQAKDFTIYFYERYKEIGNEIDDSNATKKWKKF